VEPVLESAQLVRQLEAMGSDLPGLRTLVDGIQRLVPDLVGVSLTLLEENLTVTFVEPGSVAARLDALHLLHRPPPHSSGSTVVDRLEAESGVGSSLSLAIVDGHSAALDLYATSQDAFEGRVGALVALCSASAGTTVADTDLSFESRLRAAVAPVQVAESDDISLAVGLLAAHLDLDSREVDTMLADAARRSGLRLVHLARYVIDRILT
jgi:hypothetical protein